MELTMQKERTLSIIKPDAVDMNLIGEVISRFEKAGLAVVAMRMIHLSRTQAESFYNEHRQQPFFEKLVEFMISGPCVIQVLEGENAIARNREIMGATDPAKALPGTIRRDYAKNVTINIVHGSDAPETAAREISFFFAGIELCGRK
jgi:nucleoside-diphosphate kinase